MSLSLPQPETPLPLLQLMSHVTVERLTLPVLAMTPEEGPLRLLKLLADNQGVVPVVETDTGRLLTVVRETAVLNRFAGSSADEVVQHLAHLLSSAAMAEEAGLIFVTTSSTLSEVQRLFQESGYDRLPVVDPASGQYQGGCVSRQELMKALSALSAPPRIGGMATPLGVYLHTGVIQAGVGQKGLLLMGVCYAVATLALDWGYLIYASALAALFPVMENPSAMVSMMLQCSFYFVSLLMLVRFTPLAGYHAAEHMTINTIEAGLPLTAENVAKASRVHRRCGTNLMVLMMGVQLVILSLLVMGEAISSLGAFVYAVFWTGVLNWGWRHTGSWLQTHITTAPPNEAQLQSGVKAGQHLMQTYFFSPHPQPSLMQRIVGSGLLQIMGTFGVVYFVLSYLVEWLLSGQPPRLGWF